MKTAIGNQEIPAGLPANSASLAMRQAQTNLPNIPSEKQGQPLNGFVLKHEYSSPRKKEKNVCAAMTLILSFLPTHRGVCRT